MESFGDVLKAIRKDRKFTQKMLAEGICSQSVLSRIENDEELPNVMVMQQLCQKLGVTIDQVMLQGSREEREKHALIFQMRLLYRAKEYQKLRDMMNESQIGEKLYLESDIQLYSLYRAACQFYLDQNCEQAICYLKKGLSFTFHPDKSNATDLEIMLLSTMGKICSYSGQLDEAEYYFRKSMVLFDWIESPRIMLELSKSFYDCGSFFLRYGDPREAREVVAKGISWTQEKNSYYFLRELFDLKGRILKELGEKKAAQHYFTLADEVVNISVDEE